jgi:aspartyl-tRNA(Asn)/glutamyl-tRNA(Gln) amidotransferase subunit A
MGHTSRNSDLAFATIRELGSKIRNGQVTPVELAEFFIERLETVGRRLNAVVTITSERAMLEARRAQEELRLGIDRGPLHGIPYGVKDIIAAAGAPTTWGAAPLKDQVIPEDARVVELLRDSGAVLVAKLASVELAGGFGYNQPDASFTGPGINPWNEQAWSGGSSSGSGSAVSAGAVPFALGSETGSSILTPTRNCGLSGMRPTYGRVSRRGAMALCWTLDKLGPMCRSADCCGLVLQAISGHDPREDTTLESPFTYDPEADRVSGFRIGVVRDGLEAAQPEVRENFERSLREFAEFATLEDVSLPEYPYGPVSAIVIQVESTASLEDLIVDGRAHELTAPEDRVGAYAGYGVLAVDYLRAMRIRKQLMADLDQLFARFDGVIHPSYQAVASPLDMHFDEYVGKGAWKWSYLAAASNLAGMPAVSIPNGFGERGLPTGVQIVGRAGEDSQILAVARAYQRQTDWHTRHPDY